jgi:type III pantothenate kinase
MPILLIDAGNSRIKWALVDAGGLQRAFGAFARQDGPLPGAPEWAALPRPAAAWISNVAGATVAAQLDALLEAQWPGIARRTIVAQRAQCGVSNGYEDAAQLGTDRWAGMIGAHAAYPGEHLLIATLGTATTLEALRADGRFEGGMIAPGWTLMMHSLGQNTAQLPTVTSAEARALPAGATGFGSVDSVGSFGQDTRRSVAAGCLLAQAGLLERAYGAWCAALNAPVRLVLGGGAADEVAAALTVPYTRHDHLVLAGLALIAVAETQTAAVAGATGASNRSDVTWKGEC